jgi:hypothetical protein
MKKSEDDVFLSDGEGYMVHSTPYKHHLETSLETKQVCSSSPYHILSHHVLSVQHVQITRQLIKPTQTEKILMRLVWVHVHVLVMGVLSLILLLTFKKANGIGLCHFLRDVLLIMFNCRHMNIDYAICQALHYNTTGLSEALIEYDVACQWSINFMQRLEESPTLSLPPGLSCIAGVGKFHLGTHQQDCFVKFSLNFIHGAGQQDGEILETLWAPLNKIGSSIRAMSKASRQEMVDDHMRDSNWKKLTKIGAVAFIQVTFLFLMFLQSRAS